MPEGWDDDVPTFSPRDVPTIATRKAGSEVLQVGGVARCRTWSAARPTSCPRRSRRSGRGSVEPGAYDGRHLHFGIREHAMGAAVNGLVLSGFRAFGSSFLIFSDYMKGVDPPRVALMRIPSIFIFTHDSIGLGEDGPTHQPIEQLAMLRAQPNLYVVRPAGANETAQAYRFALAPDRDADRDRPQPPGPARVAPERPCPKTAIERGAYVLRESYKGRDELPDLILDRVGLGGAPLQPRRRAARGRGHRDAARLDAVHGSLRRAGPGLPRQGPAAGGPRARVRRGAEPAGLAPVGRRPTAR